MKTLALAANIYESGEYDYAPDDFEENYVYFAIKELMRFASIEQEKDEDGLGLEAEEEAYKLLEISIDEPEIWICDKAPFFIFKLFLESKKQWNIDPFYALNTLDYTIKLLKNEKGSNTAYISKLELRLQQFVSLVADREFISNDFTLYLSSNSGSNSCKIGLLEDSISKLELHQRQSLAERLIFVGKTSLGDIERGYPKCTYVIANIGFVISDNTHIDGEKDNRIFISLPIKIQNYTISGRKNSRNGHAEEALYDYLLKNINIIEILRELKKSYKLAENHKIYAVILDLHGTYDMCLSCSNKGLEFQDTFREKLLKEFPKQNFKTLRKYPNQLPIIIRYSSDLKYHYSNQTDDKKKGILSLIYEKGEKRDLSLKEEDAKEENFSDLDIKKYGSNLLIHGKQNWYGFWTKKKSNYIEKEIKLEEWTAFTTDYNINTMSEENKKVNYTEEDGLVNTSLEDSDNDNLNLKVKKINLTN